MALGDLAFARHFEAVFGWGDDPAGSHVELGEAARKGVAADDSDAMAHTLIGAQGRLHPNGEQRSKAESDHSGAPWPETTRTTPRMTLRNASSKFTPRIPQA
jgi:hypothetical protein